VWQPRVVRARTIRTLLREVTGVSTSRHERHQSGYRQRNISRAWASRQREGERTKRGHNQRKKERRRKLVRRTNARDITQKEFCRENGIRVTGSAASSTASGPVWTGETREAF
jgi:hypothetical protein